MKIYGTLLFLVMLCTSCTQVTFQDAILIEAPASVVFEVITDYEAYDELLPMLHNEVEIVSEQKEGLGVAWKSTGTFKGHSFTSTWTVTQFVENEMVQMEDLERNTGISILTTEGLNSYLTDYQVYIQTKMYLPYKWEFFDIYREEMQLVKAEAERRFEQILTERKKLEWYNSLKPE